MPSPARHRSPAELPLLTSPIIMRTFHVACARGVQARLFRCSEPPYQPCCMLRPWSTDATPGVEPTARGKHPLHLTWLRRDVFRVKATNTEPALLPYGVPTGCNPRGVYYYSCQWVRPRLSRQDARVGGKGSLVSWRGVAFDIALAMNQSEHCYSIYCSIS
jgi:hypothetical protein